MALCHLKLLPELAHHVLFRVRDYSRQCCQDGFSSVLVDDAPVDSFYQLLGVSGAPTQALYDLLVTLRVGVGHVVAQTQVATLHHRVKLGEFAYNLGIEVEDASVVLEQLLDNLWRDETATD